MRRAARWVGPGLLVAELVLVACGQVSLGTAAVVFVVVEAALALLVVGQFIAGARHYRRQRASGIDRDQALQEALRAVLPGPVALVVRQELLTWSSLALLVRHRRHGMHGRAVAVMTLAELPQLCSLKVPT